MLDSLACSDILHCVAVGRTTSRAVVDQLVGTTWTQQTALTQPPLLEAAAATYDTTRGEVVLFGGGLGNALSFNQTWTASYSGPNEEVCEAGLDVDGDGTRGCDDSDCALACAPDCFGDAPCAVGPQCGDGVCSPIESDRTCPADCAPAPSVCGDGYCTPGEACVADCF